MIIHSDFLIGSVQISRVALQTNTRVASTLVTGKNQYAPIVRTRQSKYVHVYVGIVLSSGDDVPETDSVLWSAVVVSALASINEVNLRRARLVLRLATVSGFRSWCRTLISVCNQPATHKANSTFHPSGVGN